MRVGARAAPWQFVLGIGMACHHQDRDVGGQLAQADPVLGQGAADPQQRVDRSGRHGRNAGGRAAVRELLGFGGGSGQEQSRREKQGQATVAAGEGGHRRHRGQIGE